MGRRKIFHSLNLHFPGFQKGYESLQMLIGYLSFLSLCNDSSYPLYIYWVICLFYITLLKLLICFDCWSHLCICFKNFHSHYFQLELWYLWLYSSFSLYMVKSVNICHYVFWGFVYCGKNITEVYFGSTLCLSPLERKFSSVSFSYWKFLFVKHVIPSFFIWIFC